MALSDATRQRLAGCSGATLSTQLFKRGFRNQVLQGVSRLTPKAPALDLMSAISLDLGTPGGGNGSGGAPDARWQEVATKLDLAKAYEEMGDKDGARELLKEVVKEGDATQQQKAQTMLQALG